MNRRHFISACSVGTTSLPVASKELDRSWDALERDIINGLIKQITTLRGIDRVNLEKFISLAESFYKTVKDVLLENGAGILLTVECSGLGRISAYTCIKAQNRIYAGTVSSDSHVYGGAIGPFYEMEMLSGVDAEIAAVSDDLRAVLHTDGQIPLDHLFDFIKSNDSCMSIFSFKSGERTAWSFRKDSPRHDAFFGVYVKFRRVINKWMKRAD